MLSACMPIYYGYLLLIVNSTDYLSNTYYFSYMLLYFNIFHTFAIANPSPAKRWIVRHGSSVRENEWIMDQFKISLAECRYCKSAGKQKNA